MIKKFLDQLKRFDWILFFSVVLLAAFGLAEIYSIALGQGKSVSLDNFRKQAVFIIISIILLFVFSLIDYHFWSNNSKYLFLLGVASLVLVLIFGRTINGTKGWFDIAGMGIQPVEFVKIILIIFLANYFSHEPVKIRPLKQLVISGFWTGALSVLILLQPDMGSTLLLIAVWLFFLVFTGFKKRYLIAIVLLIATLAVSSWFLVLKEYQKQRLSTFINPTLNSLEEGYNVTQAIIAVGSGGLKGRGLGFGSQSQLKFLPEAQTDFIFAVVSEELGFFGIVLIFLFFGVFYYRLLSSSRKIKNDFGIFFVLGATGLIFIEMFINIGMNIGLSPVVGISLPFLSYGGSSMISSFILVGMIESMIIRAKENY